MRYIDLRMTDKELKEFQAREEVKALVEQYRQLLATDKKEEAAAVLAKANTYTVNLSTLCGDAEILRACLDLFKMKDANDNRRYIRVFDRLEAIGPEGTLELADDDWKWLTGKFEEINYGQEVKDQNGNTVPMFPPVMRRRIGKLHDKVAQSPDTILKLVPEQTS